MVFEVINNFCFVLVFLIFRSRSFNFSRYRTRGEGHHTVRKEFKELNDHTNYAGVIITSRLT